MTGSTPKGALNCYYRITRTATRKTGKNGSSCSWLPLTRELSSECETEGEKNFDYPSVFRLRRNPPLLTRGGKDSLRFLFFPR